MAAKLPKTDTSGWGRRPLAVYSLEPQLGAAGQDQVGHSSHHSRLCQSKEQRAEETMKRTKPWQGKN